MGVLHDIEKVEKVPLQMAEPGRAAAICKQLHYNLLPIFLVMVSLCYLDR